MADEAPEDSGAEEVIDSSAEVEAPESSAEGVEAPAEGQVAPAQADVWGNFRQMEQFQGQDDQAIANRLYEAMQREQHAHRALQQYQSIVPVAQEYIKNREQYEQWKAGQTQQQAQMQQPQAAPVPEEKPWWQPPELKDSYKRYLTRDENGNEVISEDAPLDAKAALQDHMEFRADFAKKFLDNPEEALGGMVEKIANQRAESMINEKFSRLSDENYVNNIEKENKDWLYDEGGNVSAEGLAVQKYISDAKGLGLAGAQARWDYATKMVERDLLLQAVNRMQQPQQPAQQQAPPQAAQQQVPQQPTVEQRNMDYLRNQAMRTASQRSAGTDARVPQKQMTFQERLAAAAQESGLF